MFTGADRGNLEIQATSPQRDTCIHESIQITKDMNRVSGMLFSLFRSLQQTVHDIIDMSTKSYTHA